MSPSPRPNVVAWTDVAFLVSDLAFSFGSWGIAILVLLGGRRWPNVLLALYLVLWGMTPRFLRLVTPGPWEPADDTFYWTFTNGNGLAIMPVYLAFLGSALSTPLARPFSRAPVRALLLVIAALAILGAVTVFQADFNGAIGPTPWSRMPAGVRTMVSSSSRRPSRASSWRWTLSVARHTGRACAPA